MYDNYVKTPDTALCHLFLHICFKDGVFTEDEIDFVAAKFSTLGLQKELNFKDELRAYRTYSSSVTDEAEYVQSLIRQINPTNEAALFSYCLEIGLSDTNLSIDERSLLDKIAASLGIDTAEQETIQKLMIERKVVETQKFF